MRVACAACVACAAHIAHAACVARAGRAGASKTFNNKSNGRVEIQTTRNMPARGMLDGGAGVLWLQRLTMRVIGHLGLEASLAQLAEHALRKRMVVGSIPTGGLANRAASEHACELPC